VNNFENVSLGTAVRHMSRACTVARLLAIIGSTAASSVEAIPGADPTGERDSSAALNAQIRALCNATCDPIGGHDACKSSPRTAMGTAPRDAVLDLQGGVYRLSAPIAVDSTVACSGTLRIRDGTLLADISLADHRVPTKGNPLGTNHSFLITVLDYWNGLGVSLEHIVFASNGTGGGLRVDAAHHVHVSDSNFLNFVTIGIWGSNLLSGSGHDLAVDRCRLTECTQGMAECADITKKKATAIVIEFPDSHFRNTVISCGFRGIVNRGGANNFASLHIWPSCTGSSPLSSNTTVAFADEVGSSRISDCYFDNALVEISGYRGSTITNCYFNGGSRLILAPPVKVKKQHNQTVAVPMCTEGAPCKINATDPQCQYWKGAVCGLVVTNSRFQCDATCKSDALDVPDAACPVQCATINTTAYAIPAAADIYVENNAFEGKAPDVSVCTKGGKRGCIGKGDCEGLFSRC
jgi:hypothetical protein